MMFNQTNVGVLPPKLCITKCKPKMTKIALLSILLDLQSFSTLLLLESPHKQRGWGRGQTQQNQRVFQVPNLNIKHSYGEL